MKTFESDESVLRQAALQRISLVRKYQLGAYQEPALALLNELSKAFVCLTDSESREQYDAVLRGPGAERLPAVTPVGVPEADVAQPVLARLRYRPEEKVPAGQLQPKTPTCPSCGKAMPAKRTTCYSCGYRRAEPSESSVAPSVASGGDFLAGLASLRTEELVRQDLSPEQILARLQHIRDLHRANQLGRSTWGVEGQTHCCHCHRPIHHRANAYGMRRDQMCQTVEWVHRCARIMESLGRTRFSWPLSSAEIARVYATIPQRQDKTVCLLCLSCLERFWKSPKVG